MRRSFREFGTRKPTSRWALAVPLIWVLSLSGLGCSEPDKAVKTPTTAIAPGSNSPDLTGGRKSADTPTLTTPPPAQHRPAQDEQAVRVAACVPDESLMRRLEGTVALPDGMQRADGDTEFFLEDGTYKLQTFNLQHNGRYRVCRAMVCTQVPGSEEKCRALEVGRDGWGQLDSERFLFKKIERN